MLKAVVDSLDQVEEAHRGFYEEADGKFRLNVEGADALVDTSGLKSALEAERKKGKLADAIRKEFPSASEDEIRKLIKKAKETVGRSEDPDDQAKLSAKIRKQVEDELAEKYGPVEQENTALKAKLHSHLVDGQVRQAALKAGIFPEDVEDVLVLTRQRFRLNQKDQVEVLDKDGDPSGMSLDKFFSEAFKKEKPRYYKAPDASGGADPNGTPRRPTGKTTENDDLSKLPPADRLTEARRRAKAKTT